MGKLAQKEPQQWRRLLGQGCDDVLPEAGTDVVWFLVLELRLHSRLVLLG